MPTRREKPEAFLSHRHEDEKLAKGCKRALEKVLPIKVFLAEEIEKAVDYRQEISSALKKASCFILLFTDPSKDWSWCFYEAGLYSGLQPLVMGDKRPVYCLHPQDTPSPSPLANLQSVKAQTDDIQRWIGDLCELLRCKRPSSQKIKAAAEKVERVIKTEQVIKARSVFEERVIKPNIWVTPSWPGRRRANFNAARLPSIVFDTALVTIDQESALMLGYRTAPQNYDLLHFLKKLDSDSVGNSGGRPYWMARLFDSLNKAVSGNLNLQEVSYFRHEEGSILRPVIVSVAKNQDGSKCRLKVLFARAYDEPLTDRPTPLQHLAIGVRLAVRTRVEIIEAFLGRMSQIYRDKIMSTSPTDELAQNFPVGGRLLEALEAIYQEARAHGIRPKEPAPSLFPHPADQRDYENIRARGVHIWEQLKEVAKREDRDANGHYPQSERLLAKLKEINDQFLKLALPRLELLLGFEDRRNKTMHEHRREQPASQLSSTRATTPGNKD